MPPDLVAIGHVSRDSFVDDPSWRLGGAAFYAAATAARLSSRVALATRVGPEEGPDLLARCAALGVTVHARAASCTTAFEIGRRDGHRSLRLLARAEPLSRTDVPVDWRAPAAMVLAPIVAEIEPEVLDVLRPRVLIVAAQGWLRRWDRSGSVQAAEWKDAPAIVARAAVTVVSEDDVPDERMPERWSRHGAVVVTRAGHGARLVRDGRTWDVDGFPVSRVVDATGAGDAFAAGLALALANGHDVVAAVRRANAVASFAVEGFGIDALGDRAAVERRLGEAL